MPPVRPPKALPAAAPAPPPSAPPTMAPVRSFLLAVTAPPAPPPTAPPTTAPVLPPSAPPTAAPAAPPRPPPTAFFRSSASTGVVAAVSSRVRHSVRSDCRVMFFLNRGWLAIRRCRSLHGAASGSVWNSQRWSTTSVAMSPRSVALSPECCCQSILAQEIATPRMRLAPAAKQKSPSQFVEGFVNSGRQVGRSTIAGESLTPVGPSDLA
ncbi:hypothetical protein D3C72_1506940 [compost metagenome]